MARYVSTAVPIDISLIVLLSIVLLSAVIIDMKIYKIPNLLTYPAIALSIMIHTIFNGTNGFLFSMLGFLVGTAVFLFPFLCGVMGAGDAKLMGTVGAVLGVRGVLNAFLFTAIAGGIFSIVLLLIHYRGISFISRYTEMVKVSIFAKRLVLVPAPDAEKTPKVCYGVAIAAGTLYTMCWKLAFYSFPI